MSKVYSMDVASYTEWSVYCKECDAWFGVTNEPKDGAICWCEYCEAEYEVDLKYISERDEEESN